MSKTARPFSVFEMVEALAEYVTGSLAGEVSVASKSSELSTFLPIYSWKFSALNPPAVPALELYGHLREAERNARPGDEQSIVRNPRMRLVTVNPGG